MSKNYHLTERVQCPWNTRLKPLLSATWVGTWQDMYLSFKKKKKPFVQNSLKNSPNSKE